MKPDHYTECLMYQMEQLTAYCHEKGEQYFKAINAGLNLDQFVVLDVLSYNNGICQMDLAKIILKDRVYTSRIVNILEEKGLIERKLETKGKRLIKGLYLTNEGKKNYNELKEELHDTYGDVFNEISDEEINTIRNGIQKLKDCIAKYIVMPL